MLLLTNLMDNAQDEGYAEAAARRPEGRRPRPSRLLGVGLLAVGLLLATAAAQVRERAPAALQAHSQLAAEITRRTAESDRLERDLDALRVSIARARRDGLSLTDSGTRVAAQLTRLEAATGAAAVVGPGLVVHLVDAADTAGGAGDGSVVDPRGEGQKTDGRVSDRDLQTVVNEVWAAGAEAVAVNGARLTALSAIRSAGDAVLVDFRPLSPPYDVVAIGAPGTLRRRLVDGFGGSYLQVLRNYGITYSVTTRARVRLPASGGVTLREATVPRGSRTPVARPSGPSGPSVPSQGDRS
jgi:uncharacterized protein YlxW (UPF0749 family)